MDQCYACVFWKQNEQKPNDRHVPDVGQCRRHAPQPDSLTPVLWPEVKYSDGCGEFKTKFGG